MEPALDRLFLDCSARRLDQLAGRIESCLGMLNEEQVWMRGSPNENAIGNLVLHLCGNLRQWIVAGVGGSADVRERDREFAAAGGASVAELRERLRSTVDEALTVLRNVTAERLGERVSIQKYDVTVLEAVYHVVEHFALHTGQVIFATKMLTGADLGFYRHLSGAAHNQKTP
jgi:uncharacterized damage-inducible protein DinB